MTAPITRRSRSRLAIVAVAALGLLLAGCGTPSQDPAADAAANVKAQETHGGGHSAGPGSTGPGITTASTVKQADGTTVVSLPLPEGEYTPSAPTGGTDDYRCFLVDPKITSDTFLSGVQFVPGNAAIVHHVILFRVNAAQVATAKRKDAGDDGQGWNCFGGTGIPNADPDPVKSLDSAPWLAAWAPGGKETRFGDKVGVAMPQGTQIVIQMHYNLLAGQGSDSSGVRLRLAAPGADLTPLETMLLVAPVELPCAANENGPLCRRDEAVLDVVRRFGEGAGRTVAGLQLLCDGTSLTAPEFGPTQSCDRRVDESATVLAAAGHMHLLGRSIRIELNPGTPEATTLLDVTRYDFDNQGSRPLAAPVKVRKGDVLRVTCTHDVRLRTLLPALKSQQPRYVVWGEGTSDEMCLGVLSVTRP